MKPPYLKRLPINVLKIDRAFVKDICTDENDRVIIELIVGMAKSLGLSIVAEGSETEEHVLFLEEVGCHTTQGYFYSPPVDEEVLWKLFEDEPFRKPHVEQSHCNNCSIDDCKKGRKDQELSQHVDD